MLFFTYSYILYAIARIKDILYIRIKDILWEQRVENWFSFVRENGEDLLWRFHLEVYNEQREWIKSPRGIFFGDAAAKRNFLS